MYYFQFYPVQLFYLLIMCQRNFILRKITFILLERSQKYLRDYWVLKFQSYFNILKFSIKWCRNCINALEFWNNGKVNCVVGPTVSNADTPPLSRSIMNSPFTTLVRSEHTFAHIHPQSQVKECFFFFVLIILTAMIM